MNQYSQMELMLRDISTSIRFAGRSELKDYKDISKSLFEIMQILYFRGRQKGKELAKRLDISRPAVSEKIRKLEQSKYIQSEINKKDKREIFYSLTPKGSSVIKAVIQKRIEFLELIISKNELNQIYDTISIIHEKSKNELEKIRPCN